MTREYLTGFPPKSDQARGREAKRLRAQSDSRREAMLERWEGEEATPETLEKFESVPSRRRHSPLSRMLNMGSIDMNEYCIAERIQRVIEVIHREAGAATSHFADRVDCSGSAKDALVEAVGRVRAEATYSQWRAQLPEPAGLVIQMLSSNESYVKVAATFGVPYRTARQRLIKSLAAWNEIERQVCRDVDRASVEAMHERLGGGVVPQPKSRSGVASTPQNDRKRS